jgi:hypothetical protein
MSLTVTDKRNLAVRGVSQFMKENEEMVRASVSAYLSTMQVTDEEEELILEMLPLMRLTLTDQKELRYG